MINGHSKNSNMKNQQKGLIIVLIITAVLWGLVIVESCAQCNKSDVCILVDYSGSVEGNEAFISKALTSFLKANKHNISKEAMRVSIIPFDDNTYHPGPLSYNYGSLLSQVAVLSNQKAEGGTNLSYALSVAEEVLNSGREGVAKTIILICDGDPAKPHNEVLEIANKAKSRLREQSNRVIFSGVYIRTYIEKMADRYFMKKFSNEGYYFDANYETLYRVLEALNICI